MKFKDCNDCLKAGLTAAEMRATLDRSRDFSPDKIKSAAEFREAFLAEWFDHELESGIELSFAPYFKIRNSELTVWTGIEKSGKSTLLGFVIVSLLSAGERALVASMEIKAAKTLKKLSRQAFGGLLKDKKKLERCLYDQDRSAMLETMREEAGETLDWLAPSLWLYDHVGILHWRTLLDDITWAVRRHGITQVVVDNFMRLGFTKDDYAQQAEAITALAQLAMDLGVHIHLVVHQNKNEGKGKGAMDSRGKRNVSGAFEIIANAHNIVEVIRDSVKGEKVGDVWGDWNASKIKDAERDAKLKDLSDLPDGKFVLHAQRDGEQQNGSTVLWFLYPSQQYVTFPAGHAEHCPTRFVQRARDAKAQRKPDVAEWAGEVNV